MRAVIQRVEKASVVINHKAFSSIGSGLLVLLGIENNDEPDDIEWLCGKIARMRIFDDENGVMNKSVLEMNYELLLVSQFTLHASTKKGNRPSYTKAAIPEKAIPLYEQFISEMEKSLAKKIKTGQFGAMMHVELINNGPVTIIIDTKNRE